jgi:hypothetical protein
MVKRVFGIVLTVLGAAGLVIAGMKFMNGAGGAREIAIYGILGAIFFFSGIGLVKNTHDRPR